MSSELTTDSDIFVTYVLPQVLDEGTISIHNIISLYPEEQQTILNQYGFDPKLSTDEVHDLIHDILSGKV